MAEQTLKCPKCGGEIRYTSSFCEHCGTPIEITVAATGTKQDAAKEEDPELQKAKEEYFKKRAAIAPVTENKRKKEPELSVNPNGVYAKAALIGGFLLGLNFLVLALSYLPSNNPMILFSIKEHIKSFVSIDLLVPILIILFFVSFGFILPIVMIPIFRKKVDNIYRKGIRRSLRFIMVFNWLACAAPIFMGIIMLAENFFGVVMPGNVLLMHNLLLLLCYIVFATVAFKRYVAIKNNKSISEICMSLHFDNPTVCSFALFALVILVFALASSGQ